MEIEFHPNGMDGFIINMMMYHFLIARISKILSLKSLINGHNLFLDSDNIHQELHLLILDFCSIKKKGYTDMQINGNQQPKELDLNHQYITMNF